MQLFFALVLLCAAAQDPVKDLRSRDAEVRLAAVRTLATEATLHERHLAKALQDDDWEVAELAAIALGDVGPDVQKATFERLVDTALEGPVGRMRRAAARSLGRIDAIRSYTALARKIRRAEAVRALEAVAAMGEELEERVKLDPIFDALDEDDVAIRRAAAFALIRVGSERRRHLERLLEDPDLAVRARAIEGAGQAGHASVVDPLFAELLAEDTHDTLQRRCIRALRTNLERAEGVEVERVRAAVERGLGRAVETTEDARALARVARLLGSLAEEREGARALPVEAVLPLFEPVLARRDAPAARSAAAAALALIGTDAALERIEPLVADDPEAGVRLVALVHLAQHRAGEPRFIVLAERALGDADARIREAAAVQLGVLDQEAALEPLIRTLADDDWRVVLAAAVSIGITERKEAAPDLVALYASEDWRVRGAGVAGLARIRAEEGVTTLLAALDDPEPLVARTAYEFFRSISSYADLPPERGEWTEWWAANRSRIRLSLPPEVRKRRAELAYAVDPLVIYEGLDVLVLQGRGDHVEDLLAFVGLDFRLTQSARIVADAVHPGGVFVSNCEGSILAEEAERLEWFVHSGGYLFGSCWALRETIQKAVPGYVRKAETGGTVVDDVRAYPVDAASPWVEGVFRDGVQPIYHLEGAHLIEVLEPELVHVLVDSPECAAAWRSGNLAAWFQVGHGLVLDSANHFDVQGLATAVGLKKPEDRMAYAVDHLGLTYTELRELRGDPLWKRVNTASARVKDLSVFRLVTNFVRTKRTSD